MERNRTWEIGWLRECGTEVFPPDQLSATACNDHDVMIVPPVKRNLSFFLSWVFLFSSFFFFSLGLAGRMVVGNVGQARVMHGAKSA